MADGAVLNPFQTTSPWTDPGTWRSSFSACGTTPEPERGPYMGHEERGPSPAVFGILKLIIEVSTRSRLLCSDDPLSLLMASSSNQFPDIPPGAVSLKCLELLQPGNDTS